MSFYLGMRQIEIDNIVMLERARKDLGDIDGLCQSIKKLGLLQAICVNKVGSEYHLVDGQRRIEAYKELGHNTIPAIIYDFDNMSLEGEYDANMVRKSFTPSEAVALAEKIKTAIANRAKLRQYNASQTGADSAQDPEAGKKTRDIVAKAVGYSHDTLKKASQIVKAAESDPTKKDLVEKMDKKGKVGPQFRELQERLNNSDQRGERKITPVVYMPDGRQKLLSHLTSNTFKSGSVLNWIAGELNLVSDDLVIIERLGSTIHVYQHTISNGGPGMFVNYPMPKGRGFLLQRRATQRH